MVVGVFPRGVEWEEYDDGVVWSSPRVVMTSDSLGSWGCGAFTSAGEWFQIKLPESWAGVHIRVKELLPIVIGVAVWRGQTVARVIMQQW